MGRRLVVDAYTTFNFAPPLQGGWGEIESELQLAIESERPLSLVPDGGQGRRGRTFGG